jgi:hypothetical protein
MPGVGYICFASLRKPWRAVKSNKERTQNFVLIWARRLQKPMKCLSGFMEMLHFIWLSVTRSDENFEHETSECEICSTLFVTKIELRLSISLELHDRANSESFFLRSLITGDESWVYGYDPETKMRSSHWKTPNSPRTKKARHVDRFLRY